MRYPVTTATGARSVLDLAHVKSDGHLNLAHRSRTERALMAPHPWREASPCHHLWADAVTFRLVLIMTSSHRRSRGRKAPARRIVEFSLGAVPMKHPSSASVSCEEGGPAAPRPLRSPRASAAQRRRSASARPARPPRCGAWAHTLSPLALTADNSDTLEYSKAQLAA